MKSEKKILKPVLQGEHVSYLLNKKLMNGFLGNAKYTRTLAGQYLGDVNEKLIMTFLVVQNTRGHSPFPSRRSTKSMQKPSIYQQNALGEFHLPEKITHVLFLGNLVGSKVL